MPSSTKYPTWQDVDNTVGLIAWTYAAGDIFADDGSMPYSPVEDGDQTVHMVASIFGFAIPADATITGITVRIGRKAGIDGVDYAVVKDAVVRLVIGGVVVGQNKADTGTAWTTSETEITYGGSSDLWDVAPTYAEINASNFGAALSVTGTGGIYPTNAEVDYITIEVHYTSVGGGDVAPQVITLPMFSRDEEPGKPRTVYAFAGDVILDPVVDDYYGGAVVVRRPSRHDDDDQDRRPLLSYVSASDFTEAAVFAWQPQCLVLSANEGDEHRGRRPVIVAPVLLIADGAECGCFGSLAAISDGCGTLANPTTTTDEAGETIETDGCGTLRAVSDGCGTLKTIECDC